MARKFNYRGQTIEQLQALPLEQFLKLMPSKHRRTLKRMSPQVRKFLERFRSAKKKGKVLETHFRQMPILPEMVGTRVKIYTGKEYRDIEMTSEKLGHRLGDYAITIKQVHHSGPGIGATRGSKAVELK